MRLVRIVAAIIGSFAIASVAHAQSGLTFSQYVLGSPNTSTPPSSSDYIPVIQGGVTTKLPSTFFSGGVTWPATGDVVVSNSTASPAGVALSANQILGALTSGVPAAISMPSCSSSNQAINWTSGTGPGCVTISGGGGGSITINTTPIIGGTSYGVLYDTTGGTVGNTAAGTTTTVLHGNAAGAPSFGPVALTTDVSGVMPVANGGTGIATLLAGTVPMGAGTSPLVVSEITDVASGGVVIGSPTGGQKGAGTINMTGCFINNVACASGGSTAFSAITGGTNTTAAMVVGSGASIGVSGSGTIAATSMPATGLTGTLQAAQFPALTGDVATTAGSLATTIAANAVTNAKAAQMIANTVKGNFTGSTANSADNAMPACTDTGGNHLNFTSGSGITCGTSSSAGSTIITLNPGLASNPSVYNTGTQTATNGSTVSPQIVAEAHATSYTLAATDGAKLPYFTVASQTATFPNPGAVGSTTFNFGYDGSHSYSITTAGGTASIYGCGTAGTTVSGITGQIQLVPDVSGNYQCLPNFSSSGSAGVSSLAAGTPDLSLSASSGAVTISSTAAGDNPTTASYTILATDAAKTVDRTYTAGAMTDTLPNVSASGFGQGFKFVECADSTQQITLSVNTPSLIFGNSSIIIAPKTCIGISNPLGTNYVAFLPAGISGPGSSTNGNVMTWNGTGGNAAGTGLAVGTSGGVLSLLNANKTDSGSNTYSGANTHSGGDTFADLSTFSGTVVGAHISIAASGNLDGNTACGNTVHYTGASAGTITLLANTVPADCNFAVDATAAGLATMAVAAGGTQVTACTTARTRATHSVLWVHVESNAGSAPVVNVSGDCG